MLSELALICDVGCHGSSIIGSAGPIAFLRRRNRAPISTLTPHLRLPLPDRGMERLNMQISRRRLVALGASGLGSAALLPLLAPLLASIDHGFAQTTQPVAPDGDWATLLIRAAENQIGVTVHYDGGYRRIGFPGGNVERSAGVCTDVVIRAYRDAFGFDLQEAVNRDMKKAFSAYPTAWGLARPDSNIDHRRVLNLERFFLRRGAGLSKPADPSGYRPGDLVTQRVGSDLPHIAIVSDRRSADGLRPLVVHNIGAGTRTEDTLAVFPAIYRFRFKPPA
jgi:uncharacterized protein YijF (DUF1287 family)